MLQAMNTGHDGSLSTLHANSPRDALARVETMVLMAGVRPAGARHPRAGGVGHRPPRAHRPRSRRRAPRDPAWPSVDGMEGDTRHAVRHLRVRGTSRAPTARSAGALRATGVRPKLDRAAARRRHHAPEPTCSATRRLTRPPVSRRPAPGSRRGRPAAGAPAGRALARRGARHVPLLLRHRRLLVAARPSAFSDVSRNCPMSTAPVVKSPVPAASHGITCSMFGGRRRGERVAREAVAVVGARSATTPRSTRPERCTTLSVTWLPGRLVRACPRARRSGASAIPTLALSTTRFFVIDVLLPAGDHDRRRRTRGRGRLVPARRRAASPLSLDHVAGDGGLALRRRAPRRRSCWARCRCGCATTPSSRGRGRPTSSSPSSRAGCTRTRRR